MDGQVASAAALLGSEQVYSGGTYYFGGKRRGGTIWAIEPYLQLLPLCLGDAITLYLRPHYGWNDVLLSLNMEMLNGADDKV